MTSPSLTWAPTSAPRRTTMACIGASRAPSALRPSPASGAEPPLPSLFFRRREPRSGWTRRRALLPISPRESPMLPRPDCIIEPRPARDARPSGRVILWRRPSIWAVKVRSASAMAWPTPSSSSPSFASSLPPFLPSFTHSSSVSSGRNLVSSQRVRTCRSPCSLAPSKSGWAMIRSSSGVTVAMPLISSSPRARRARSIARVRVGPVTMSLAIIESNSGETLSPRRTPVSMRMPWPAGQVSSLILPAAGARSLAGSSEVRRSSMEWPRTSGTSGMVPPSAMVNWASTRSSPVTSSETVCSTWRRGLTSRKWRLPSSVSMNSQVPRPTYPVWSNRALDH